MPAVTCADVPSGATSARRTTAVAIGTDTARWSTTSGKPRIDSGSSSGAEVNTGPNASSGRRSRARPLGEPPAPHDSEPRVPVVARCR